MKKFRDMTDSEIAEIIKLVESGGKVRYTSHQDLAVSVCTQDYIDIHGYYEIPKRPMSIDWSVLKDEYICAAKNKEGTAIAFSHEPYRSEIGWHGRGGLTQACFVHFLKSYDPGTVDWQDSLIWRPGHESK